jgi:hypothetical protein
MNLTRAEYKQTHTKQGGNNHGSTAQFAGYEFPQEPFDQQLGHSEEP